MAFTKQTDQFPEIGWDITNEVMETDDHVVRYLANGESEDGQEWTALAVYVDGEFDEIDMTTIEKF